MAKKQKQLNKISKLRFFINGFYLFFMKRGSNEQAI